MDPLVPPAIHFTSPSNGIELGIDTVIVVAVEATDADGVIENVEFKVDGQSVAVISEIPYQFTFESDKFNSGVHTISATATDDDRLTAKQELTLSILDPRDPYCGNFKFTIVTESWMMGFPTTWSTSYHDGFIKRFELADKADDFYPEDDSWQNPLQKITLNFKPGVNITSILESDGTLEVKDGYHYHHEGHFIGLDSISFKVTGMGGLGGGWNYYVSGTRM